MNSSKPLTKSQLQSTASVSEPLKNITNNENNNVPQTKLKLEVQQLQHKLKIRTKAVSLLQQKLQTSKDLDKIAHEIEQLMEKNEKLQGTVDNLFQENQVLGQIIDRMKAKVQTKSGVAVDELETAFVELNKEYEQFKLMSQQHSNAQHIESETRKYQEYIDQVQNELRQSQFKLKVTEDELMKTKQKEQETVDRCQFYKCKFMDEAKELLRVRESFKQVVEDNKTHVQYIQVLEKRIRELETQASSDIERLSKRIQELRLRTIQEAALINGIQSQQSEKVNLSLIKAELTEEQSQNQDLKQQLSLLASSKDQIQASLAICRHNLLQITMKLEEEVRRVFTVEKMRLEDIQEQEKLRRILEANHITIY